MGLRIKDWREPGTIRVDLGSGAWFTHVHLSKGEREEWADLLDMVGKATDDGVPQEQLDADFSARFGDWLGRIVVSLHGVEGDDGADLSIPEWAEAMVREAPNMAGFVASQIVAESGVTERQGNN